MPFRQDTLTSTVLQADRPFHCSRLKSLQLNDIWGVKISGNGAEEGVANTYESSIGSQSRDYGLRDEVCIRCTVSFRRGRALVTSRSFNVLKEAGKPLSSTDFGPFSLQELLGENSQKEIPSIGQDQGDLPFLGSVFQHVKRPEF